MTLKALLFLSNMRRHSEHLQLLYGTMIYETYNKNTMNDVFRKWILMIPVRTYAGSTVWYRMFLLYIMCTFKISIAFITQPFMHVHRVGCKKGSLIVLLIL